MGARRVWPKEDITRIPYWIYSDPEVYAREQERVFCGPSWSYVALEAELPHAGDFKRTFIGEKPVLVVRDRDGSVNVVENRCAHRGVQFCQRHLGNASEFMCPYHQWTYDLKGNLIGVPFRRGVKKQGGMPADFDPKNHGLRKLNVTRRRGVIFASFAGFGLFRADQPSKVEMDSTGRHGALISWRGEQKRTDDNADMKSLIDNFRLHDPGLLDTVREFPEYTVVMTTLWPNLIIEQQSNTLAMRQLITRGPGEFELAWTFFGYADDEEEMRRRRLRQANLMGPGGLVSIDDSEVMKFSQLGVGAYPEGAGLMEMGGRDWKDEPHMVTESVIRAFYAYYRQVMEL
jgi:salicylate 5-hydroxylase large subunit